MSLGAILIAGALLADLVGLGGAPTLGLRQLVVVAVGLAFIAVQLNQSSYRASVVSCIAVWTALGLLCGFCEAGRALYRTSMYETILAQSDDYAWMIPLGYLLLFSALGVLGAVAHRLLPRWASLPVMVMAAALLAVWSVIRTFGSIHELAALALAVGCAVTFARAAARRPDRFVRTARVGAVALIGVGAAVAAVDEVSERLAESRALAALPPPPKGAPNVLLVVLDTLRADSMGVYGGARDTTPHMDAFAKSGTVFDWAIAPGPWTLPSHATLFTGRYPHELSCAWTRPLDDSHRTLAEELADHGYATGGFVANLGYCHKPTGLARGFAHYEDYYLNAGALVRSCNLSREIYQKSVSDPHLVITRNSADQIRERFVAWLDDRDDRPWFAFLNFFDVHGLYIAPPPYDTKFGPAATSAVYSLYKSNKGRWSSWSQAEAQGLIDAYDGCLAFLDNQIGLLLDEMAARGVLDETLVIITGDHGELFGEHNLQLHANCLYRPLLHVPLIVRYPTAVPGGVRVSEFVSLRDLPATVLDLVGIEPAGALPGHSLAPLWSGQATGPRSPALSVVSKMLNRSEEYLPAARGPMRSLFEDGLHYIYHETDKVEELYDVRADPAEAHNLIEQRPDAAARLRAALERALEGQ